MKKESCFLKNLRSNIVGNAFIHSEKKVRDSRSHPQFGKNLLRIITIITLLGLCFALFAQADKTTSSEKNILELFKGKSLGCAIGSVNDLLIQNFFGQTPRHYSDMTAGFEDVRRGRLDGYITDLSVLRTFRSQPGNQGFQIHPIPPSLHNAPMGGFSKNQAIIDQFNIFLATIEVDGTFKEMQERWLENVPNLDTPMPDIPRPSSGEELNIATCLERLPFSYRGENGIEKGYSIEMALRFGAYLGRPVKFHDMEFSAMIPFVVSGKADIGLANVSITEERQKSVLFTDPIFYDQSAILTFEQGR